MPHEEMPMPAEIDQVIKVRLRTKERSVPYALRVTVEENGIESRTKMCSTNGPQDVM